jgi:hypothetical protein
MTHASTHLTSATRLAPWLALAGALVALSVTGLARADDDPLGFYVGGAVGLAQVRSDQFSLSFDQGLTGWKVLAGIRPISVLGAEVEYVDFGHPHTTFDGGTVNADVKASAEGLYGLVYLPIPLPALDFYAKAGVARLQTSTNAEFPANNFATSSSNEHGAYGAGARVKFGQVSVGLEYERVAATDGSQDLYSLGVLWGF